MGALTTWLRGRRAYLAGSAVLLLLYAITALVLAATKDFSERGPLSFHAPRADAAPEGASLPPAEALDACFPQREDERTYKVVAGHVDGAPYYGCYEVADDGDVFEARVVDGDGDRVTDVRLLKDAGTWRWIGTVKTETELVLGGVGLAAILAFGFAYYRRLRPGADPQPRAWYDRPPLLLAIALTGVGLVLIAMLPGLSRARKVRLLMQTIYAWIGVTVFFLLVAVLGHPDAWGLAVVGLLVLGFVFSVAGGRLLVAPPGFGAPAGAAPSPAVPPSSPAAPRPSATPPATAARPAEAAPDASFLRVVAPARLPSFADVGGMHELKQELLDTLGLTLAFAGEAEAYRISWNGILLHGPPGVGKTFLARALAGELGLSFIPVATGDLVSSYRGASAQNVRRAFAEAATRVPCLLFFDEFDSVAQRRDDTADEETRRTVNQLLQSLEEYRVVRELVVMAATNSLDDLDEAVVRPGRFDRHVHVGLPDAEARAAIVAAQLRDRPVDADVDEEALAARTEGFTAAAIANVVEAAALAALREATSQGTVVHIDDRHLLAALAERGGRDRPEVDDWTWDELILDPATKGELQELQRLIEDPERARRLGVDPPGGVLLTGPPGTGKTTIARVLAAQSRCSFYPVSAADLTSKWLGESERAVKRLFERARQNAPSIVFIDEIDAIASRRGDWGSYDRQINELLQAMDGIAGRPGVFVLAATNRPDKLDPALLRGGRLGRTLEVPLPDEAARLALLRLFSRDMPVRDVDLPGLAARTTGWSGADLRALCQQAALNALAAAPDGRAADTVGAAHFDEALTEIRPRAQVTTD